MTKHRGNASCRLITASVVAAAAFGWMAAPFFAEAKAARATETASAVSTEDRRSPRPLSRTGGKNAVHDLIHPQALHHEGKTFVAYQGVELAPEITAYDHEQQEWSPIVTIGPNRLMEVAYNDTHGAPALTIDADGRLHVFWGSHGTPQQYARSLRPGNISAWELMPDLHPDLTYPQPMTMADGSIRVFARKGVWPNPFLEFHSTDGGDTWSDPVEVIDFLPSGVYARFTPGADRKTVHVTFVHQNVVNKPEWLHRRRCFYAMRDAEGAWRNAAGERLEGPITLETAVEKCLVATMEPPRHSNHAALGVDENDQPYLLYLDGHDGRFVHKFAEWDAQAQAWDISSISETDHHFDNNAAIFASAEAVDVYLVAGGVGMGESLRGGDIEHWRRTRGEREWRRVERVLTAEAADGPLYGPQAVRDGVEEARVLFCTYPLPDDEPSFDERIYLYGGNGFVYPEQ